MILTAMVRLTLGKIFFENELWILQDEDKSKVMRLCFFKCSHTHSPYFVLQWNISNQLFNVELHVIIHMKIN